MSQRDPRDELFSDFERATDRLERSTALNSILEALGVEEPTYEDLAKIQRWVDGYNATAFDVLIAKGWRKVNPAAPAAPQPVDREALAKAWDQGHSTGWKNHQDGGYGNDYWDDETPNPYRLAGGEQS